MTIAPRTGNLEKVGFFHFVDTFEDPIGELKEAIKKERKRHSHISNSLIVLPEAFNTGGPYNKKASPSPAKEILKRLHCEIADPLHIAFVAGILDGRNNSAYWVDAKGSTLMCRKMDKVGPYDPRIRNTDRCNPITCANGHIAALICMDATDQTRMKLACASSAADNGF